MQITSNSWKKYIKKLSAINSKAGNLMREWIEKNGTEDSAALINYAYSLVTKYGEAAAALACAMYDATALLQKAKVLPAEPAPTATYTETAIAVNGAKLKGDAVIPNAVDRLVKLAGQDTTMMNARRDEAWWAWIPQGDTCAFCITLASRGWQRQSKKAKNNHAEHIHANCDCAYAVNFSPFGNVEGYDPDKYLEMYNNAAPGQNSYAKINALRRQNYAKNRDAIRARSNAAYARNKSGATGAYDDHNDPFYKKREKAANDLYKEIQNRDRKYEIEAVANNTGYAVDDVDTIFAHIFEKDHKFADGSRKKFDANYYMANSWMRLREGKNIQEHDLMMLKHELKEARIMSESIDISYEEAHNITEKEYSYQKLLLEYLKTHKA